MDTIKLSNGKIFSCDYLSTIPIGYCFIAIHNSDASEIMSEFSNEDNVSVIEYCGIEVKGYKKIVGIGFEDNGIIKVTLRRKYDGE